MKPSPKQWLEQRILQLWYTPRRALPLWAWLLWPLASVYSGVVRGRRLLALRKSIPPLPVPVIVVGNLTVGGTGKTPLIIALAAHLQQQGWHPGIVLRGYRRQRAASSTPLPVTATSDVAQVGDEAVLLAQRSGCPVMVGATRYAAAAALIQQAQCDVVLSDDGLQHYALPRALEIAVIDGLRGLGNRFCLPLGPLREPSTRLASVELRVCTDGVYPGATTMRIEPQRCRRVIDDAPVEWTELSRRELHAVAGIGNPRRFFNTLLNLGLTPVEHPFSDHHAFAAADFVFLPKDAAVVMTQKDAVKCREFADERFYYVEVSAVLPAEFFGAVQARVDACLVSQPGSITTGLDRCNA